MFDKIYTKRIICPQICTIETKSRRDKGYSDSGAINCLDGGLNCQTRRTLLGGVTLKNEVLVCQYEQANLRNEAVTQEALLNRLNQYKTE